jgi:transposase
VLAEAGARVHLAHPLGIKGLRVKNDVRDAADLAALLRMGRLPEAWIAPPATRELRELVRHRAKLVALRSGVKGSVHAVLAKQGQHIPVTDLFGVRGQVLLAKAPFRWGVRGRPGLVQDALRIRESIDNPSTIDSHSHVPQSSSVNHISPRYGTKGLTVARSGARWLV